MSMRSREAICARPGIRRTLSKGGGLNDYELHQVPLTTLTRAALEDLDELTTQQKDLCKNAFALGLAFWMFDRPMETTLRFYAEKFASRPQVLEANTRSLKAGYHFGETSEVFQNRVDRAVTAGSRTGHL